MATRVYFEAGTGDQAASPGFSANWNQATSIVRAALQRAKTDSALNPRTSAAETATTVINVAQKQYVSEPLAAQTISGTMRGVIRCNESAAAADMSLQLVVRVVTSANADRGVLYAGHAAALNTTVGALGEEMPTTGASRIIPSGTALTSVTCQAGDRLVIEWGARAHNTVATSYTHTLTFGDPEATADFPLSSGNTTSLVPWLEFSGDLFPATTKANTGRGGTVGADAALTDTGSGDSLTFLDKGATSTIKYVNDSERGVCYEIINGTAGETSRIGFKQLPPALSGSARFYVKWAASATSTDRFAGLVRSNASVHSYMARILTSNKLTLQNQDGSAATGADTSAGITAGVWYRIEHSWTQSGPTTLTHTYTVYQGDSTSALYTVTGVSTTTIEDVANRYLVGAFAWTQLTSMRISSLRVSIGSTTAAFGADPVTLTTPFQGWGIPL